MTNREITTELAPLPVASYSQAVVRDGVLYLAGQGGFVAESNALIGAGVEEQTRQALTNLRHVVEAAGATMSDVVTVRVYISEHEEFQGMNAAYSEFFERPYPARTTVSAGLAPGMKVEIDAVAVLPR